MTKLDFAIHLFTAARTITSGSAARVPVVSLLMLLILSRRPGEWMPGPELAAGVPTMNSSTLVSCTKAALEAGLLERRAIAGGVNGALEWRATAPGLRIVEKLMKTAEPQAA